MSRQTVELSLTAAAFVAVIAIVVWCWSEAMNDYSDLRIWDRFASSGIDYSSAGDTNRAVSELKDAVNVSDRLSDPVPYRQISQNRLADALLEEGREDEARKLATDIVAALEPIAENRKGQASRSDFVRVFELVCAKNKLGSIARKRRETAEAVRLFKESNNAVIDLIRGELRGKSYLAFRREQMVALVNLLELSDSNDDLKHYFEIARFLDQRFVFDSQITRRLQAIAHKLRSRSQGRPEEETPSFRESAEAIKNDVTAYDRDLTFSFTSRFRTREDNYNILVESLRLAEIWRELGHPEKAEKLLLALADSTVPAGTFSASLCLDLGWHIDAFGAHKEAIRMLERAVSRVMLLRPSNWQRAELLSSIAVRKMAIGDRTAIADLKVCLDIHKTKLKEFGHHTQHVTDVACTLAQAQVKFARPQDALATLEAVPSVPGMPTDPRVIRWRFAASNEIKRIENLMVRLDAELAQMSATGQWLNAANKANHLASLAFEQSDLKKAKAYVRIGLAACKKVSGPKVLWSQCFLRNRLATIFLHEKKFEGACKLLEKNVKIMRQYQPRNAVQDEVLEKATRQLLKIQDLQKTGKGSRRQGRD